MSENTFMLPLPIELREKIYGDFVQQHTLDARSKLAIQFHCAKLWVEKLWNGFKREESSRKLYAIQDFITMMIDDMNVDQVVKNCLAACWCQGGENGRQIQTSSRWVFILFGRTEESFLNVVKMKTVLLNFYIRYEKRSLQDKEESVEILKGYILFDRDVTENTVLSSLATKNVKKLVTVDYGFSDFSEMDTFSQCLGKDKLHQDIIEHKEKWKNRGICKFAL